MKHFVELWNAKASWLALTEQERGDYLSNLGPHIKNLMDAGVEIITWSKNSNNTIQRASFDFFAIWKFPNDEMVSGFQQLVEGAGWYNYFEQVNISGDTASVEDILGALIKL